MTQMNADSQNDPETHAIIGAVVEVHRELGLDYKRFIPSKSDPRPSASSSVDPQEGGYG